MTPLLKRLEMMIQQASQRLADMQHENHKLGRENAAIKLELLRLREQVKSQTAILNRHERLKTRLERLSRKLENIT